MLPYEGGLAGLPILILGIITRSSANRGCYRELAAINLTCRTLHEAMPDAFACTAPDDEAAFTTQASAVDAALYYGGWGDPSPGASSAHLTLRLDLDRLGDLALSGVPLDIPLALLRCTAERFATVPTLQLSLQRTAGVLGGHLFSEYAAPLLHSVRHLTITGPRAFCLPPIWRAPAAAAFTARITQLSVTAHHSGLGPLAAQLPASFPSLTALHLTVDKHRSDVDRGPGRRIALTVATPPALRVLLVSAVEALSAVLVPTYVPLEESDDDGDDGETPTVFRLAVQGDTSSLLTLGLHSILWTDTVVLGANTSDFQPRSLAITGDLSTLEHLNLTVSLLPAARDAHALLAKSLAQTCPGLERLALVVGGGDPFSESAWAAFVAALAPLADGGLRRVDVLHTDDSCGEEVAFGPRSLPLLFAAALPEAELRVRQLRPQF